MGIPEEEEEEQAEREKKKKERLEQESFEEFNFAPAKSLGMFALHLRKWVCSSSGFFFNYVLS